MSPQEALRFALDWPALPLFKPRCNVCGESVSRNWAMFHMDSRHPGWLETWNEALRAAGLDPHNRT